MMMTLPPPPKPTVCKGKYPLYKSKQTIANMIASTISFPPAPNENNVKISVAEMVRQPALCLSCKKNIEYMQPCVHIEYKLMWIQLKGDNGRITIKHPCLFLHMACFKARPVRFADEPYLADRTHYTPILGSRPTTPLPISHNVEYCQHYTVEGSLFESIEGLKSRPQLSHYFEYHLVESDSKSIQVPNYPQYVRLNEASIILNVDKQTIRKYVDQGLIESQRIGKLKERIIDIKQAARDKEKYLRVMCSCKIWLCQTTQKSNS